MAEPYRRTLLDPADEIRPPEAGSILGIRRTTTYTLITALQQYVDPATGLVRPLPDEYLALRDQSARAAWRRGHLLVIPAWGAESVCNADWRLSRLRVTAWALTHGWRIPALLAAARAAAAARVSTPQVAPEQDQAGSASLLADGRASVPPATRTRRQKGDRVVAKRRPRNGE